LVLDSCKTTTCFSDLYANQAVSNRQADMTRCWPMTRIQWNATHYIHYLEQNDDWRTRR
jgi:hypothetical protein